MSLFLGWMAVGVWGGAAALAVGLLTALLGRLRAPGRLLALLWLAVGLRFLCPFGVRLSLPGQAGLPLAALAHAAVKATDAAALAVLPQDAAALPAALAGEQRIGVLLHERAHIRCRDTLTKPLFYLAAALHWWNPLAWLAFGQFSRQLEAACDEAATRGQSPARRRRPAACFAFSRNAGRLAGERGPIPGRCGRNRRPGRPHGGCPASLRPHGAP